MVDQHCRRRYYQEQRQFTALAEDGRWELLDGSMTIEQLRRTDCADCRDARVSVGGVADQREVVGNEPRLHAESVSHRICIEDLLGAAVHLHDAVVAHALREVLVRWPDADLFHRWIFIGDACRAGKGIVSLELDHRPHSDAQAMSHRQLELAAV